MPLVVTREPYFSYYIDLYDGILETKKKFQWLKDYVEVLLQKASASRSSFKIKRV